jgi:hypothetical protein
MKDLGRIQKVELRQIWTSESSDFTPWLARPENLKLLADQYVDSYFGSYNEEKVKILRKLFLEQKETIEREIGGTIEWSDNEESGRFWISTYRETDPLDVSQWPQQHEWLKQALEKLIKTLSKHLAF